MCYSGNLVSCLFVFEFSGISVLIVCVGCSVERILGVLVFMLLVSVLKVGRIICVLLCIV